MATLKTANGNGKYSDTNAKENVISYILNPYKAKQYSGSMHITDADPIADMERISRQFGKEKGIQLRHFIISFDVSMVGCFTETTRFSGPPASNIARFTRSTA